MSLIFNKGYNVVTIDSFRFHLQADFYIFDIDVEIIDSLFKFLSKTSIKNEDWNTYNLFTFDDLSVDQFKTNVVKNFKIFCKEANIDFPDKLFGLCWLNILEPNENLNTHFHSLETNSFFSCNVSLGHYTSTTSFHLPWADRYGDYIEIQNCKGGACIFPSWLWHGVYNNTEKRYTLGIDFYTEDRIKDYFLREHNNAPAPIQFAIPIA